MNTKRSLLLTVVLAAVGTVSALAQPVHDWRHGPRRERHPHHRVAYVTFYEHAGFRGASLTIAVGEGIPNLSHARFDNGMPVNDRISSIRVDGPVEVTAYEHSDFRGGAIVVSGDVWNLDRLPGRWNDTISSLHLRYAGRRW